MGIDKYKAIHRKWRIPETSLFVLAFLGGPVGGFIGMFIFRHKIRKPKFYFLFTLAFLLHLCLLLNYTRLLGTVLILR